MSTPDSDGERPNEPLSVYPVIMIMVDQMASIAWQKLGLQHDPMTGSLHKDLVEAKVAIDVTAGLAGFIEPHLDDEDKRRIHGLIRDLRINYVEHNKDEKERP